MERWCFHCQDRLVLTDTLGWVHPTGSMYGQDGHAVLPVTDKTIKMSPPR